MTSLSINASSSSKGLHIKARQIEDWADGNLDARQPLSVLLRRLIHSTGHELRQVDFPGFDNAERKGSDGLVDAGAATQRRSAHSRMVRRPLRAGFRRG